MTHMSPRRRQVTYSQRPNHSARSVHARGERLFRTYDTSYIRPKQKKGPVIIMVAVLVAIAALILWGIISLFNSCTSANVGLLPDSEQATVTIDQGEAASSVAKDLVSARLIKKTSEFTDRVNELNISSALLPGTYTFSGGTSVDDIVSKFVSGPDVSTVTIPEGYRLSDIANAVQTASNGRITADAFKQQASNASVYASSYSFLADAGTGSLEGFLFPKTYNIPNDATADSLIRQMLDQFQQETAGLDWSYPQSQGLTIYQAVNLASIVEKESSGDEQVRAQVAAVFYNRLTTQGEPSNGYLQSDATTAYEVGHDPTADEVHADTPYSTYTHKGLPPTPICSPSIDCLQAVCSPNKDALGKYYFFYFEGDQYHFSQTYDEHMSTFSN